MLQIGRKRSRSGFTLIELVLSVLIIAVLVGVSMPLFRAQFSDLELRNSCYNIAKLISFAQRKAVGEAMFFKINIDSDTSRYWLTAGKDLKTFERLKSKYGRVYSLPKHVEINAGKKAFIFFPNGSSEKISIILRGEKSSFTLKSKGRLGYVEIERRDAR